MDEVTLVPHAGYVPLARHLDALVVAFAAHAWASAARLARVGGLA